MASKEKQGGAARRRDREKNTTDPTRPPWCMSVKENSLLETSQEVCPSSVSLRGCPPPPGEAGEQNTLKEISSARRPTITTQTS